MTYPNKVAGSDDVNFRTVGFKPWIPESDGDVSIRVDLNFLSFGEVVNLIGRGDFVVVEHGDYAV